MTFFAHLERVLRLAVAWIVLAFPPAHAHISTQNRPDGRCHEDDPCWIMPGPTVGVMPMR